MGNLSSSEITRRYDALEASQLRDLHVRIRSDRQDALGLAMNGSSIPLAQYMEIVRSERIECRLSVVNLAELHIEELSCDGDGGSTIAVDDTLYSPTGSSLTITALPRNEETAEGRLRNHSAFFEARSSVAGTTSRASIGPSPENASHASPLTSTKGTPLLPWYHADWKEARMTNPLAPKSSSR